MTSTGQIRNAVRAIRRVALAGVGLLSGAIAIAPSAYAGCSSGGCDGRVQRYYVDLQGIWLDIDGDETQLSPCTAVLGRYIKLPRTYAGYNEAAALLLTAHAQDKVISITVVPQAGECVVAYIVSDRP